MPWSQPGRMNEIVINIVDSLPEQRRTLFAEIVGQRDPELLAALRERSKPSVAERKKVEKYLSDALMTQFVGPDYEPTELGRRIEHTIDAFLEDWPFKNE